MTQPLCKPLGYTLLSNTHERPCPHRECIHNRHAAAPGIPPDSPSPLRPARRLLSGSHCTTPPRKPSRTRSPAWTPRTTWAGYLRRNHQDFSPQILSQQGPEHLCTEPGLAPSPPLGGAPKLYPSFKAYHPQSCHTCPPTATTAPGAQHCDPTHRPDSSGTNVRRPVFSP